MKKNNQKKITALPLFLFVMFVNLFFFHAFGSIALWMLITGLWVLIINTFNNNQAKTSQVKWIGSGVLLLSMSTYLMVNAGEKITALILISFATMLVSIYSWLKQDEIGGILELGLSGITVAIEYLRSGWDLIKSVMNGSLGKLFNFDQSKKEKSPWVKSIVIGIIVGLPLISWLVMTLVKADPIFAKFTQNIISEDFFTTLPVRLVLSTLIFLLLVPTLIMKWRGYKSPLRWMLKAKWGREMTVVVGMMVMVLGIFLVVQWPYVFAKVARETDLSQFGVATYSEYVNKGFGDLLKVVVMVFGVSWISYLLNKNQKDREKKILMWAQGLLGLEFVIFIISIFRRVWLYQSYHGLTLARLYGLVLLILIMGMTLTMTLRYFYPKVRWVKVEMSWILIVIFGAIWMNMEAWVVKYSPTVNERIDYVYLARLSSDGREGWKKSYVWATEVFDKNIANEDLIKRDDRRDIFYARLITRDLIANNHRLIMQYGSDDEIREYFRKLIENEKRAIENAKSTPEDIKKGVERMNKSLEDLDQDDWFDKVDVSISYLHMKYGWTESQAFEYRPYFFVHQRKEEERLSDWDKKLAWDWSRNKVYEWMKQEIGITKLLELQQNDLLLQQRVKSQPKNEREFDIDISLESKFLR